MYSGNTYKNFPEFYDLLYRRFLKSVPDFLALIKKNTPNGGMILDLATGTGEVSIPLLKSGFIVTSLDLSRGMLKVLILKAEKAGLKNYRAKLLDMQKINYKQKFDAICIRQAINYFIGTKALRRGFEKISNALKPGGKFIFNAPNYQGGKTYPAFSGIYKKGKQSAFILETNKTKGRLLKHQQYSIIWGEGQKPNFVTDENTFYMFTEKEFEGALKSAGFSKIKFSGSDKTLYCVATK
jgi:SAM-dependent methyltransferase